MARKVEVEVLRLMRDDILNRIRMMSFEEFHYKLELKDYHGFGKADFTGSWIKEILLSYGLTREDVQVDIIFLWTDLTQEVHQHLQSRAEIYILGQSEHMPSPKTAEAYLDGIWSQVKAGDSISVGQGQPHGFRIPNAQPASLKEAVDTLYFLSLQNPPIVTEEYDDYHRVNN